MQVSFTPSMRYSTIAKKNTSNSFRGLFNIVDIKKLVASVDIDVITQNAHVAEMFASNAGNNLISPANLQKLETAITKAKTAKKLEAAAYLEDLAQEWRAKLKK